MVEERSDGSVSEKEMNALFHAICHHEEPPSGVAAAIGRNKSYMWFYKCRECWDKIIEGCLKAYGPKA